MASVTETYISHKRNEGFGHEKHIVPQPETLISLKPFPHISNRIMIHGHAFVQFVQRTEKINVSTFSPEDFISTEDFHAKAIKPKRQCTTSAIAFFYLFHFQTFINVYVQSP